MNTFVSVEPKEVDGNVFQRVDNQWMLITAGTADSMNTMTASWGGFGILWNKPVCFCFIRPTRYTYEFTEREDCFSLSFLPESFRTALRLCGTVSGRDTDKIRQARLTPRTDAEAPYFDEAELVFICRKIYQQDIDPAGFLDPSIQKHYQNDYHRIYTGEIIRVLRQG